MNSEGPAEPQDVAADPPADDGTVDNVSEHDLIQCERCDRLFRPYSRRRKVQRFCPGGRCRNASWMAEHPRMRRPVKRPRKPARPSRWNDYRARGQRLEVVLLDEAARAALDRLVAEHGSKRKAVEYALTEAR